MRIRLTAHALVNLDPGQVVEVKEAEAVRLSAFSLCEIIPDEEPAERATRPKIAPQTDEKPKKAQRARKKKKDA